ncbi:MAG TPA: lipid A export permease/ATP-binding protein MsbA [Candidatus Binatia bacterium]|nr:lipid A export permease/ATP-binding protein MsbA [Candidatus Binatia bacterium]
MNRTYRRLLGYLRPYFWPHFSVAVISMVLFSSTNGVMPFLVRHIFDDVFTNKDVLALQILPGIIIGTFLARGVFAFGSTYLTEYVGQRIIADVRNQLNEHIQHLSLSFFNRTPTGTILSRVTNDVVLVRAALTDAVASILKDATSLIVLVVVAFVNDWVLALIAFVAFPASVLPLMRLSKRLRGFSRKGQISIGNLTVLLQETVQGNRVVKAFGMEDYEQRRFGDENQRLFKLSMKATRIRAFTTPMLEILAAFGIAGVVWYGGHSVINGGRTQGSFLAFLTALFLLYEPFKALAKTNNVVQQGLAAAERVFELLDTATDVPAHPHGRHLGMIREGLMFQHVSFRYDHDMVLKDVNLTIRRGQLVALVGPSGGGKSTLADLVLRFYDVTEGVIAIDGVDIRQYDLASLRAQIALVTQHTFLFNDTVRNNIAYGNIECDMDAIVTAAKAANAHDFIAELPDGYDTIIGELGFKLSGGQRQRLAIARALLKNAPLLVLDEATSALDNESERLVQIALETLMEGRTTLVIAHRLSTIRRADRIVVLSAGRVVEEGTHDELLALNAEYRKLHDLQFREPETGIAKTLH